MDPDIAENKTITEKRIELTRLIVWRNNINMNNNKIVDKSIA